MAETRSRRTNHRTEWLPAAGCWLVAGLVTAVFFWILGGILWHGMGQLSWEFLTAPPRHAGREGGIGPILVSTVLILAICMLVSLPIGIGASVLLANFTSDDSFFGRLVRRSLDML